MSLKSKIEAVIYASEEPVTLQQLVGLLAGEAQEELDALAAQQAALPLDGDDDTAARSTLEAGSDAGHEDQPTPEEYAVTEGEIVSETGTVPGGEDEGASNEPALEGAIGEASAQSSPEICHPERSPEGEVEEPALSLSKGPAFSRQQHEGSVAREDAQPTQDLAADIVTSAEDDKKQQRDRERAVRDHIRRTVDSLMREYAESDRGIEIREVASGFRMGTKPEYHDAVRGFVKSLKPALKLTLPALETLAVVAYKQPVTAAEISEIRGVDSAGVLGGLMTRKLIATAGRKQVIGRPMLYKTTREFLMRFGLKDVHELPSMEEFERMAGELAEQEDLPMDGADGIIEQANARGDAEMLRESQAESNEDAASNVEDEDALNAEITSEATEPEATAEIAAGGNDEEAGSSREGSETAAETEAEEEHAG